MERKARLILIVTTIIVLAVYLPYFLWLGFSKMSFRPRIEYSPVNETFIIRSLEGNTDREGKRYSPEELANALPFSKYQELAVNNALPDSVKNFRWDTEAVKFNNDYKIFSPYYYNMKDLGLYPLFETNIVGSVIKPDEFFRINDRIEFVDARTNELNENLSQEYSQTMKEQGFEFPGKKVFGTTSSMKRYDEGYFVVDVRGKVFHIKKQNGEFTCVFTNITNGLDIKMMHILTSRNRKLHALVSTCGNELFVLTTNNYGYIKLPLSYNPDFQKLAFRSSVLNYQFSVEDKNKTDFLVTDTDFLPVDSYCYVSEKEKSFIHASLIPALFPFTLNIQDRNSRFLNPSAELQKTGWIGNSICLIIFLLWVFIRRKKLSNNVTDIILVALFGVYALIAVFIFPNFKNLSFKG